MILLRFFQAQDALGHPAPQEFLVEVPVKWHTLEVTAAVRYLVSFRPRLSAEPGSYFYDHPDIGSGWVRVEGLRDSEATLLHELLTVEDINVVIGLSEPWREDPPVTRNGAPRAGNPWFLLGAAVFFIALVTIPWVTTTAEMTPALEITKVVSMVLFIGLGLGLAVRGLMRMRWWTAARAEARRRGIPYPNKLSGLGT